MMHRLRGAFESLGDLFWLRPACIVAAGIILSALAIWAEGRANFGPPWWTGWIYSGGEAGARALLGAVASSTIGVAGTVFSITVAALSLASGQMGPRLLRNFTRDGGNQVALGIFLGTFVYALMLLRSVRSADEGAFIPHLGVSGALLLALLCVGTLIWFVHHIANGINVNIVIDLVHRDLSDAILALTSEKPAMSSPAAPLAGTPIAISKAGYLRTVDDEALADWAAKHQTALTLLVRPGDYILPGLPIAEVADPGVASAAQIEIASACSIGSRPAAAQDLEFAVRQLVEVAVRALSPGINDPFTATAVLDHLGAALTEVAPRNLAGNVLLRDGTVALHRKVTDYAGLCDAMFHMIRQNAASSAAVLIRLIDVLQKALQVEKRPERQAILVRHAQLALAVGRTSITDPVGLSDLESHFAALTASVARRDDQQTAHLPQRMAGEL
ncbi:DUF2254 domain-containing protein [Roseomonas terrae]|uniref:DUF2254 domain-containing protein n=1 Tax=Neoroseomonas terrae TaxID=424799 RepID=A0ABS5ECH4_9PROT|nr:DUF2254 domain-containing protein [Neoroseomonas terrae]MBR0648722.1 DUF2254 domain-containing protein [Neoroseomonas terrae]